MDNAISTVRRIVVVDENDRSRCVADGPAPDVLIDPARPGYSSAFIWATDRTPARIKGAQEAKKAKTLEPAPGGSVCRVVTFPPDSAWKGKVGAREVQAYFASTGSAGASTYTHQAPHPYMQKTRTLDFCLVLKGEITLVLDTEEVHLKAGDTVVQRGTNHAWSNRSDSACVVAFSSHDARY
jgi:quercetin dioxygenase-like cupin family protein